MANETTDIQLYSAENIQSRIYTIRGVQVMLDRDLAFYYGVETRRINEQMKRNQERFPEDFCFQLTKEEAESILKSQNATSNTFSSMSQNAILNESPQSLSSQNAILKTGRGQNIKKLPYAYTEQGVSQLSSVLKSPTAAHMSVRIMRAFVAMRRFITANAGIFQRIENIERHQIETDNRIDLVLDRMEALAPSLPSELVFMNGQFFNARLALEDLIRSAHTRVIIIDAYVSALTFSLFDVRAAGVTGDIYTVGVGRGMTRLQTEHNSQPGVQPVNIHQWRNESHDRWLIIDDQLYHCGHSLDAIGGKISAITRMGTSPEVILSSVQ